MNEFIYSNISLRSYHEAGTGLGTKARTKKTNSVPALNEGMSDLVTEAEQPLRTQTFLGLEVVPSTWYEADFPDNLRFLPSGPLVEAAACCGLPHVLNTGGQRLYLKSQHLHF